MDRCPECGAPSDPGCGELFHRLLALDHSREEPWGPLHGVAVACYRLQHPASLPDGGHQFPLDLLRAFTDGGVRAANRLTGAARRANSHRAGGWEWRAGSGRGVVVGTALPSRFAVTIEDVAVDGSFPAAGYPERLHGWVQATLAAWER